MQSNKIETEPAKELSDNRPTLETERLILRPFLPVSYTHLTLPTKA